VNAEGFQLIDYVRAIRRRWPVVVMITFLVVAAALTASFASQKQYDGSAELLFTQETANSLLPEEFRVETNDPERQLNTAVSLITNENVTRGVRRRLRLNTTDQALRDSLETTTSSSSDIITLTFRDPDPRRAAAIANAFADEYVGFRRRSARDRYDDVARLTEARLQALTPEEQAGDEGRELRARRDELETAAALQTGGVEVVSRASPADSPSRPRPRLAFALGLFFGGLLGCLVALALEFADRRIKDEEGMEEVFDLPVLAAIPPPPRRGVDDHLQREAFGMLAANVRLGTASGGGEDSQVVMVTSPSPEEGKTSVSLGLARALARLGVRVIVIEADLRRPSISRYTGLPQSGGLARLIASGSPNLAHEVVWLDAATMRPVTLDGLKEGLSFAVLTAGSTPPHPQRLLARPEMAQIVETARSLAGVVIIDTPPIGTVTDAVALGGLVDTIVVVARLNKTTKDAARRAIRVLRNLSARLAGVAVTDAHVIDQYGYYGPTEPVEPDEESPSPSPPVEGARR
jgi:capsular exopolysaccharide synthesis family protein